MSCVIENGSKTLKAPGDPLKGTNLLASARIATVAFLPHVAALASGSSCRACPSAMAGRACATGAFQSHPLLFGALGEFAPAQTVPIKNDKITFDHLSTFQDI